MAGTNWLKIGFKRTPGGCDFRRKKRGTPAEFQVSFEAEGEILKTGFQLENPILSTAIQPRDLDPVLKIVGSQMNGEELKAVSNEYLHGILDSQVEEKSIQPDTLVGVGKLSIDSNQH